MELFIFTRFHACDGADGAVAAAVQAVLVPTRAEPGCISVEAFRSTQDPRLFHIHSRWIDEPSFAAHGGKPHTAQFLKQIEPLTDQPIDVVRAQPLR